MPRLRQAAGGPRAGRARSGRKRDLRVLLDACVWGGALAELRDAGVDAEWVGDADPTAPDEVVLARARDEGRVLITLDKDFGELVVVRGLPHGGIVRLVGFAAAEQAKAALTVIGAHQTALRAGALVTANAKRVTPRVRPPEPKR